MQMPNGVCSIGGCGIFGDSGGSSASPGQNFSDSFLIFRNIYFTSFPFLPLNFSFLGHVYLRLNHLHGIRLRAQIATVCAEVNHEKLSQTTCNLRI